MDNMFTGVAVYGAGFIPAAYHAAWVAVASAEQHKRRTAADPSVDRGLLS